jgi:hypothetical protein
MGLTYYAAPKQSLPVVSGSTAEGTTGRKRSVLLLALTIILLLVSILRRTGLATMR